MKTILIAFIALITTGAFAQVNHWTFSREIKERARNHREYVQLQRKYPGQLRNENPRTFKTAIIHVLHFNYTGPTVCEENDPRLKFVALGVTVCLKNNACRSTAPLHPYSETDPCEEQE